MARMGRPPRPALERFARQSEITVDGCINWIGHIDRYGYGQFLPAGGRSAKKTSAHRWAYEHFVGPIPEGFQIDHLCRNRKCVSPEHLEAVTPQVNVLRGMNPCAINAQKTHCPKGHPLFGPNVAIYPGRRVCRKCKAAYDSARHAKKKAS